MPHHRFLLKLPEEKINLINIVSVLFFFSSLLKTPKFYERIEMICFQG